MGIPVSLGKELISMARLHSSMQSRSVPKQIEHWAKIGRLAEENPELNYFAIQSILLGLKDVEEGKVEEYRPGLL